MAKVKLRTATAMSPSSPWPIPATLNAIDTDMAEELTAAFERALATKRAASC